MLRADAEPFAPQSAAHTAWGEPEPVKIAGGTPPTPQCSTAFPSPTLGSTAASPLQSWAYASLYSPGAAPGAAPYFELPEADLDGIGMAVEEAGRTVWLDDIGMEDEEMLPKGDDAGDDQDGFKLVGLEAFEQTVANLFTRKATAGSVASTDAEASPRASALERAVSETSGEVLTPTFAEAEKAKMVALGGQTAAATPGSPHVGPPSEDAAKTEHHHRKTWNTVPLLTTRHACDAVGETLTLTLSGIPINCTRDGLIEKIHEMGFRGDVDFVYMPVDLKTKRGTGTAITSFRTGEACERFADAVRGTDAKSMFPASHCQKKKQLSTSAAPLQGKEANVQKLRQSSLLMSFLAEMPQWQPKLVDESGDTTDLPASDGLDAP